MQVGRGSNENVVRRFDEADDEKGTSSENVDPNTCSIYGNGSASADEVADTKKPNKLITRILGPKDDVKSTKRPVFTNPMRKNHDSKSADASLLKPVSPSKRQRDYTGANDADEKVTKQKSVEKLTREEYENDDISYGLIYDTTNYKDEIDEYQYVNKMNPHNSLNKNITRQKEGYLSEETKSDDESLSSSGSFTSNDLLRESSLATQPVSIENKGLEKCLLRRARSTFSEKMYPTYELYDNAGKLMIVAQKMRNSKMAQYSNYHFFDMTRGTTSGAHSKKSGNYLGKLRCKDSSRCDYVLLNHHEDPTEVAAVSFDKVSIFEAFTDVTPRSMRIVLPDPATQPHLQPAAPVAGLRRESSSKKHRSGKSGGTGGSLLDLLNLFSSSESPLFPRNMSILKNKQPSLKNGKYFLNFNGRVRLGSLKNFQLQNGENEKVICQFGKVEENDFHLDFAHPLTPMQAFAIALCQFNL